MNPQTPRTGLTQTNYHQLGEHLVALTACLDVIAQAAALPDPNHAIEYARLLAAALLLGVKQHCLLAGCSLDYQRMNQAALTLRVRHPLSPAYALEALPPTARAIQAIFDTHNTCDCMANICREMVRMTQVVRRGF